MWTKQSLETFCAHLLSTLPRLDAIINNACQVLLACNPAINSTQT